MHSGNGPGRSRRRLRVDVETDGTVVTGGIGELGRTPGATRVFRVADERPVVAEPFRQWVIEDDFAAVRPHIAAVGAILTDDIRPWELYKLRLLNAGHTAIAHLSALQASTATSSWTAAASAVPSTARVHPDQLGASIWTGVLLCRDAARNIGASNR